MRRLKSLLVVLQVIISLSAVIAQVEPMLQYVPKLQYQFAAPIQPAFVPQPIAQQPGDEVRYWFDQARGQWCCTRNGTLYVWGPTR